MLPKFASCFATPGTIRDEKALRMFPTLPLSVI